MTPFRHKSLTFRLTLLFAAVSTSVLLLLGLLIGFLVERHFEELDMMLLEGELELVRHVMAQPVVGASPASISQRLDESLVGHHDLAVGVWGADGRSWYGRTAVDFPAELRLASAGRLAAPLKWVDQRGRPFRGIAGTATMAGGGLSRVAIATNLTHHEHFMHSFQAALWSVVGLAALASGFLGWGVARRGLAPLRAICRDAAGITANRLDRRLPEDAIPLELAEVARTLNAMLKRLEESFRRLSDFSSDLAHELRTPVSNLLTQTQVTLSRARSVAEYQNVLASNAEECERLSRMITDMLFLAKSDNALVVPRWEQVDLRAEVDGLCDFYAAMAEENGVHLSVVGEAIIQGDRLMLRRAIGNLLSNAFCHTPRGGWVTVRISRDNAVSVCVENTGDTISPQHLPRLFDRFYRAEPARQRLADGVGLGLAITRSILRAHGGDASVRSANGVTAFELHLPA